MINMKITHTILMLSLLLLGGCALKSGGDYTQQSADILGQVAASEQWSAIEGARQGKNLFSLLESEELEQLAREALEANPGLQQTKISLQILQAEQRQTRGERYPQLEAGMSGSKTEGSDENYAGSLTLSWELDIWGKLADEDKAAGLDVLEQSWLLENSRNSLVASIMQSWLALTADSHAIDIQRQRLTTLEQNERFILERYRNGLGTLEDLDSARSTVASAKATLVEYQENLAKEQRSLRVLLGRDAFSTETAPESYPVVLIPLAELPDQTLAGRPDLQAAYAAIAAADTRTSVAYKELLPSISLSATLEDIGDTPSSLLLSDPVWSLLGQLTAPLFKGGSLKAAAEVAELQTAQQYQVYREKLLNAVQEVEDSLGRETELSQRIQYVEKALGSARNSLASYRQSYRTGLVDILDLLTVQKQTYDLEAQLDNLIYEQLANRIELGLALGLGVQQ